MVGEYSPSYLGVCVVGEYSPYLPFDVFFYTKHLKGVSWDTNYPVLIELGSTIRIFGRSTALGRVPF